MNTFEFIQVLKNTSKIYEPEDYLEELSSGLISDIETNYKYLIDTILEKTLTDFGNEFIHFDPSANFNEQENCTEEYTYKFLLLPIFWQEIIALIVMALHLHKNVEENSRVIALGESPLKLVFIQQVLHTMPELTDVLKKNNMSTDIDYTYLPVSRLSYLLKTGDWGMNNIFDTKSDFNMSTFIENEIPKYSNILYQEKILDHFLIFRLDPQSIIGDNKKIYFQDRAESYKTLISLICIYDAMCDMQQLTIEDRDLLYQNFYIIGFDNKSISKLDDDTKIVRRINKFLYRMITKKNKKKIPEADWHFIQFNFNFDRETQNKYNCIRNDFNLFSNQYHLIDKMTTFLTTPEKTFNNSRCVKSCDILHFIKNDCAEEIQKGLSDTGIFPLKQKDNTGDNCNIINLCLMIFIQKLGPEYISNIINNLDNIKDDIFINKMDFSNVNKEIIDYINGRYNNNILNNILGNKLIIHHIQKYVNTFITTHGVFGPCTYRLPL
jgi:hypothetical protein